MKRLVALTMCAVSLGAAAQITYPYNPDENGDGLIGVADLQGLLAYYGSEFLGVLVSEDTSSALIHVGEKESHWCYYECAQLSGEWRVAKKDDFLTHLSSLEDFYGKPIIQPFESRLIRDIVWWSGGAYDLNAASLQGYRTEGGGEISLGVLNANIWLDGSYYTLTQAEMLPLDCWCASSSRPKVNYSICSSYVSGGFDACVNEKTENGWYPLGGVELQPPSDYTQAFWRWAE